MQGRRWSHGRVVVAGPLCSASGQACHPTERRDRPCGEPGRAGQDDPPLLIGVTTINAPTPAQNNEQKKNDQTFADLGVPATLVAALSEAAITTPFPIQ